MTERDPALFIIAREARGLTQTELAKRLGIAQGAVSKIENGLQAVSDDIMAAYVRELRFARSFYEQPLTKQSLPVHFWRKRARTSAQKARVVEARMNVLRMQMRSLLRSANVPESLLPTLDRSAFRGGPGDAARLVRERWLMARGPIPNLTSLLEDHGIVVVNCDFDSDDIDGMSVFVRTDALPPMILVNPHAPGDRLRWSLAHELGHMVLHTDHNYVPGPESEAEADEFASEFTMPAADIRTHFRSVTLEHLATLKLTWRMSIASLLARARSLDAITDYRSASLWKELSWRGWRMQEPNPIPRESPSLVSEVVAFHREDLGYSDADLERLVHVPNDELRATLAQGRAQPVLRRVK